MAARKQKAACNLSLSTHYTNLHQRSESRCQRTRFSLAWTLYYQSTAAEAEKGRIRHCFNMLATRHKGNVIDAVGMDDEGALDHLGSAYTIGINTGRAEDRCDIRCGLRISLGPTREGRCARSRRNGGPNFTYLGPAEKLR